MILFLICFELDPIMHKIIHVSLISIKKRKIIAKKGTF